MPHEMSLCEMIFNPNKMSLHQMRLNSHEMCLCETRLNNPHEMRFNPCEMLCGPLCLITGAGRGAESGEIPPDGGLVRVCRDQGKSKGNHPWKIVFKGNI